MKALIPAAGLGSRFLPATSSTQGNASCGRPSGYQYVVEGAWRQLTR